MKVKIWLNALDVSADTQSFSKNLLMIMLPVKDEVIRLPKIMKYDKNFSPISFIIATQILLSHYNQIFSWLKLNMLALEFPQAIFIFDKKNGAFICVRHHLKFKFCIQNY